MIRYARNIEPHPLYARDGVNPYLHHLLTNIAAHEHQYPESGEIATVILSLGRTDLFPQLGQALASEGHPDARTLNWKRVGRAVAIDQAMLGTTIRVRGMSDRDLNWEGWPFDRFHPGTQWAMLRHLTGDHEYYTGVTGVYGRLVEDRMRQAAQRAVPDVKETELRNAFRRIIRRSQLLEGDSRGRSAANGIAASEAAGRPPSRYDVAVSQSPVALPTEIRTSRPRDPRRMSRKSFATRPRRYSAASEADFHAAMNADPHGGHHIIYADWLADQGREHLANLVRSMPPNRTVTTSADPAGFHTLGPFRDGSELITRVAVPDVAKPGQNFAWYFRDRSGDAHAARLAALESEGVTLSDSAKRAVDQRRKRMARSGRPRRYMMTPQTAVKAIQANPHDINVRGPMADFLEENDLHARPETLSVLREHPGPVWALQLPGGKVDAGPHLSVAGIRNRMNAAGSHWWDRDSMRFFGTRVGNKTFSGPGGTWFVTSDHDFNRNRGFTLRHYDPTSGDIQTVGEVADTNARRPTLERLAARFAQQPTPLHARTMMYQYDPAGTSVQYAYWLREHGLVDDEGFRHLVNANRGNHPHVVIDNGRVRVEPALPEQMSRRGRPILYAPPPWSTSGYREGITHADLHRWLGRRQSRNVDRNKVVHRDGDDIIVTLHRTPVVRLHPDGTFTLRTGGWNTPTTRRTINNVTGLHVHSVRNKPRVGIGGEELVEGGRYDRTGRRVSEAISDEQAIQRATAAGEMSHAALADWLEEQGRHEEAQQLRERHNFSRLPRGLKLRLSRAAQAHRSIVKKYAAVPPHIAAVRRIPREGHADNFDRADAIRSAINHFPLNDARQDILNQHAEHVESGMDAPDWQTMAEPAHSERYDDVLSAKPATSAKAVRLRDGTTLSATFHPHPKLPRYSAVRVAWNAAPHAAYKAHAVFAGPEAVGVREGDPQSIEMWLDKLRRHDPEAAGELRGYINQAYLTSEAIKELGHLHGKIQPTPRRKNNPGPGGDKGESPLGFSRSESLVVRYKKCPRCGSPSRRTQSIMYRWRCKDCGLSHGRTPYAEEGGMPWVHGGKKGYARPGRPRRYAASPAARILESHLRDQGMHHAAAIVRGHYANWNRFGSPSRYPIGHASPLLQDHTTYDSVGRDGLPRPTVQVTDPSEPGMMMLSLHNYDARPHDPEMNVIGHYMLVHREHVPNWLKALDKEGIHNADREYRLFTRRYGLFPHHDPELPPEFPPEEGVDWRPNEVIPEDYYSGGGEAHQYEAYRAPAGGSIVRSIYYPGGSLIPDLKKFAPTRPARRTPR